MRRDYGPEGGMNGDTTTWRDQLRDAREAWSDTSPVMAIAPNAAAFGVSFDPGFGGVNGPPVLAWTLERVYFPATYDGAEWLASVPRNPQPDAEGHIGGW